MDVRKVVQFRSARHGINTISVLIAATSITTGFEVVKNYFDPRPDFWQSEALTILFSVSLLAYVGWLILKSERKLHSQLQTEVTARAALQSELHLTENRMAMALEAAELGVWDWHLPSGSQVWSDIATRLVGLPLDAQKNFEAFVQTIHPDDRAQVLDDIRQAIDEKCESAVEFRTIWPDGSIHWRMGKGRAFYDEAGNAIRMTGILMDIEKRKLAEETQRLQLAALEAAVSSIVITDRKGSIQWANPAFTELTGYTREEVLGKNPRLLNSGKEEKAFFTNLWETITSGRTWHGELINRRKDGVTYLEEQTITPVRGSGQKISHFVAIKRDITARRALEEQLRQSQKMEAVGRLASGVAHDFNNALAIITGHSELLQLELPENASCGKHAQQILKAAERAAGLTRQLLAFSRKEAIQPTILNVNPIISELDKMLRRLIGEDIDLRVACDSALANVKADRGQIEQILMNLVVNARDAMPHGGTLLIETANVELDGLCTVHRHLPAEPGSYVMISVSDTGCGIDRDTQSHIFEPFFTTKGAGRGTGLGLSIIYGIVKQAGGGISVYSEVGKGTTFHVYLPQINEAAEGLRVQKAAKPLPRGTETILVAEDEMSLRELLCGCLESSGYRVLAAPDGKSAMEMAQQYGGSLDMLLTDVIMPEVSGPALADEIALMHPNMKRLFMSGYTNDLITQHGLLNPGSELLVKPFGMETLLTRIRAILEPVAAI